MSQAGLIDIEASNPQIPTSFVTDAGTAVPLLNILEILGGTAIDTSGSGNTVTINFNGASTFLQIANNLSDVANVPLSRTNLGLGTGNPSNGQLLIGNGTDFDTSSLTSTGGTVTITVGAGTINLEASTAVAIDFLGDTGSAMPIMNQINIVGGTGIVTSATSNIVTIDADVDVANVYTCNTGSAIPALNNLNVVGGTALAGTSPLSTSGAGNTLTINAQLSQALAAGDSTKTGMCNFDSTQFSVSAAGFVTLAGGGLAIDSIAVQTGTSPIAPTAAGLVTINGAVVAAGTNPIRSDGTGANTMAIEVQISQAIAATDATKIGLCNFDSSKFSVDANGFVTTSGTGIPNTITGDSGGALSPTAGNWNILGSSPAAGTTPVATSGSGSTLTVNVQKSQAIAATDATKIGLSNFNSSHFSVDANGFVSLAGGGLAIDSITPDSGTSPVVPDAGGNVSIIGSGSTTTVGGTNSLTVQLTGLTNHAVLVGAGTTTITKVGPTATAGQVLQSAGSSADPAFSTATYPATTTANQILYSSATNVVGQITAVANSVLITNGSSVPSLTSMATNGYLLIGATGAAPVPGTLTAGSGINITNGTNSITIANSQKSGSSNLGITYGSSTFTVTSANASSLSGSNPAYVTLQSKSNPGQLITITVSADQTFVDDSGSSTIVGNLFGFGSGDTVANDVPFFIYAVMNDSENAISFMIGRVPGMTVSPISSEIGKTGSAIADKQFSFFALGNPTVTDYDSNPCLMVGSFRMQLSTSGGDWTVQALSSTYDGIGNFQIGNQFTLPTGILGAASGSYFQANGGTAPIWSTQLLEYYLTVDGYITVTWYFSTNSTAGVGAVTAQYMAPFRVSAVVSGKVHTWGSYNTTPTSVKTILFGEIRSDGDYGNLGYLNATGSGAALNNQFISTTSILNFSATYHIGTS